MVSWHECIAAAPEPAATEEGLLFQFGVGLAFLATVRKGGGPRLHVAYSESSWVGRRSPPALDLTAYRVPLVACRQR
jgi:hypothetical protein